MKCHFPLIEIAGTKCNGDITGVIRCILSYMWGSSPTLKLSWEGPPPDGGPGTGGQGFWKLCGVWFSYGMCPRLRMVSISQTEECWREEGIRPPWPPKENQPGARSSQSMMSAERPEVGEDTFGVRETDGVEGLEGRVEGQSIFSQALCVHMSVWCMHTWRTQLESQPHLAFNLFYYFLLQNNISLFNQKVHLVFFFDLFI